MKLKIGKYYICAPTERANRRNGCRCIIEVIEECNDHYRTKPALLGSRRGFMRACGYMSKDNDICSCTKILEKDIEMYVKFVGLFCH